MTKEEQELLDQIHHAFAGVILEDGTSLNMTEYYDSGGSRPEYAERAKDDERDDWTAIPDETLEQFIVAFSFTDLKGFRFYIPAYMTWTVRNFRKSGSIIADYTTYAIDPDHYLFEVVPFFKWFTQEQIAAMIEFLEFASRNEDVLDGEVARQNLTKIKEAQQAVVD